MSIGQDGNAGCYDIYNNRENNTYLWICMEINGIISGKDCYLRQKAFSKYSINKGFCDYKSAYYSNNGKLDDKLIEV